MPELPDIELYRSCLEERIVGQQVLGITILRPFFLRTFDPPVDALVGRTVETVRRLGKRLVLGFDEDTFAVVHLMIAGRLRWQEKPIPAGKIGLATVKFPNGTLAITEASSRKRASLHIVCGREGLAELDPGGIDIAATTSERFAEVLRSENRTLKRALTNPRNFDGIGNAYSDEILFAARLSPVRLTSALSDEEVARLRTAAVDTLRDWTEKLRAEFEGKFPGPGQVTAFRPNFNVHGRFGLPCRVCGRPVQRIQYAENETNYCAVCQNEGRLLADRGLSRLLKSDWPKTIEAMLGE